MNKNLFLIITLISYFSLFSCKKQPPQLGNNSIEEVVRALTLEEKARLVVGTSKAAPLPPPAAPNAYKRPSMEENQSQANTFQTKVKVNGAAGDSYPVSRLGIPSIVYADGPAGVRIDPQRENSEQKYYATAFPIATLLASTWNMELVEEVGKAMGNEVLEYGVDILLAPGMNIHRNPLTGRNFEYFSEDPLLSGKMAAAMVNGIQSNGVGASIKHFAANNQETFRNGINTIVSERALREIYLKGFEIAVKESNPWTVMSSYNKINGEYASESEQLLTQLLRNEWGYDGFVMTDWWAEQNPVAQMAAGNDLLMPGEEIQIQRIIEAVKSRELDEKILDRNIKNILRVTKRTPSFNKYNYSDNPDLGLHATVAREAASEGMILLKNNHQTLPLSTTAKNVALLGVNSYDIIVGGHGSGYVHRPHKISLEKGITEAGFTVDHNMSAIYSDYIIQQKDVLPKENFWYVPVIPEMQIDNNEIIRLSKECEMAIITIGRNSGEGDDRKLEKGDYYLTDIETTLIKNTAIAFRNMGKKTIVVLNIGGVIEMVDWKEFPDAILLAWQPGQEAGYAIANILTGAKNPSGKLPMTFPEKYENVPSASNFPYSDQDQSTVEYKEDIFVGYRYYNTFKVKPLYEFGYGLSYTEFEYSNLQLSTIDQDDKLNISVTIKNIGKTPGKEIAQLYVTAPGTTIKKPSEELKAFAKTGLLQPRESESLKFSLTNDDLASYHEIESSWITEAGIYEIKIGSSSHRIHLKKKFEKEKTVSRKVEKLY